MIKAALSRLKQNRDYLPSVGFRTIAIASGFTIIFYVMTSLRGSKSVYYHLVLNFLGWPSSLGNRANVS